jgi:signal transduction histidine kinase
VDEATGVGGALLLVLAIALPFMRRFPLFGPHRMRRLPLYLLGLLVFSFLHTTSNWLLRTLLYPVLGLGAYDYGIMPVRYFMELPVDVVALAIGVAGTHLLWMYRASRDRELRAEQLERALTESRLQSLQLQLQPHFLFNALNTISSRMYDDTASADAMVGHLSSLLRSSLSTRDTHLVTLRAELDTLEHYLAILRGRFGDRCRVTVDVPPAVEGARVPALLLQPLVENAVRHGNLGRSGTGAIGVRGRRDGDELVLEVSDDGPGATRDPWASADGVGLRATADRLQLLFPGSHRMEAGNGSEGFHVTIRVPFRDANGAA